MILIVSGFTEYFVNHDSRTVSIVDIGFSDEMTKDGQPEILCMLGEPCSELLAMKCIDNGYRVFAHDGLASVA